LEEYYKILGLPSGADKVSIKTAFRHLAKLYHPDLNKDINAKERFQKILEAYECLYYGKIVKKQPTYNYQPPTPPKPYESPQERKKRHEQARAKLAAEKLRKEQEVFAKTYLHDFLIVLLFIWRIFLLFIAFLMFFSALISIYKGLLAENNYFPLFLLIVGFALLFYIYSNRKEYFLIGHFNITYTKFKQLFVVTPNLKQACFFSSKTPADGPSYKLRFYNVKEVKTYVSTPLNHQVRAKTDVKIVYVSRTKFAFKIHLIAKSIRSISVLSAIIFLPIESLIWKFFFGILFSIFINQFIYFFSKVKSDFYFLFNPYLLIRLLLVLVTLAFATDFTDFQFKHGSGLGIWLFLLFLFSDIIITPLVVEIPNNQLLRSFGKSKYSKIKNLLDEKFQIGYLESIPSAFYVVFKWFF